VSLVCVCEKKGLSVYVCMCVCSSVFKCVRRGQTDVTGLYIRKSNVY